MTGGTASGGRARKWKPRIARLFTYAAWADKYDGAVHKPPLRGVALAMNEPHRRDRHRLPRRGAAAGLRLAGGAGRSRWATASWSCRRETHPLAATDFYQVLETSDVPAGVVNIVTGERDALAKTLAEHDDVDALWFFGSKADAAMAEKLSAGNLKRMLTDHGLATDWYDPAQAEGPIRCATRCR